MSRHRTVQLLALVLPTLAGCITPPNTDNLSCACEQPDLEGIQQDVDDLAALDIEGRLAALEALGAEDRLSDLEEDYQIQNGRLDEHDAALERVVYLLSGELTFVVSDAGGLRDLLLDLDHYRLASDAVVRVYLNPGTYSLSEPLTIRHPDGDRIQLIGGGSDPNDVVLTFAGTSGVVVEDGHALGLLDGVSIRGDGTDGTYGIAAMGGATLHLGDHVLVRSFESGVYAESGGQIQEVGENEGVGIAVEDCGMGFFANQGGIILLADGASATNNTFYGFLAADGATVAANGAIATNSRIGFSASNNGTVMLRGARSQDNSKMGYRAENGGVLIASEQSVAQDNIYQGFRSDYGGFISASGSQASGQGGDCYYSALGGTILAMDTTASCGEGDYVSADADDTFTWIRRE